MQLCNVLLGEDPDFQFILKKKSLLNVNYNLPIKRASLKTFSILFVTNERYRLAE